MTGMGDDGARGLREMFDAGALTLGQDEGMPKDAMTLGTGSREIPLEQITTAILSG